MASLAVESLPVFIGAHRDHLFLVALLAVARKVLEKNLNRKSVPGKMKCGDHHWRRCS